MADTEPTSQKRLVLCFDGTGNKFLGDESDTNIVKIYRMLDRKCPHQYHYYQPGIGTYAQGQTSNSSTPSGLISRFKANVDSVIDQAVGTSFVHHVLSGYQFLMRYYSPGDHIYIFGFSRGAYTARFLAEMVNDIGLLSKGNEEMVHFAWTTFSDFQTSLSKSEDEEKKQAYMETFKETFCRPSVEVHFLGLFDCVNSVGQFELPLFRKSSSYVPIRGAQHIRHAVSINERRLKFKPALYQLDDSNPQDDKRLKEMWFAGNHADVGGGWEPQDEKRLLSDIPLAWMIGEIEGLEEGNNKLVIDEQKKQEILNSIQEHIKESIPPHDMLAFDSGTSRPGVLGWWVLEILPFFTRLELEGREWVPRYWPPNLGATRDVPTLANIHDSVYDLLDAGILKNYQMPKVGGDGALGSQGGSALKRLALPSLMVLGVLGAGAGVLRGQLF